MPNKPFLLTPHSEATSPAKLKPGPQVVRNVDIIGLRKHADTRDLNAKHVLELAKSIAALGLLEPLVVDSDGCLLAGGHRLAALQLLAFDDADRRMEHFRKRIAKDENSDKSQAWNKLTEQVRKLPFFHSRARHLVDGIPVQVVDVRGKDREEDPKLPLAIEVAENNVRRSYTAEEIRELAGRLKKAGYKFTAGRPKDGEVPVISVLQAAVGKSRRTIERIIAGDKSNEKSGWQNARTTFKRAAQAIIANGSRQQSREARKLLDLAKKALAILDEDGSG